MKIEKRYTALANSEQGQVKGYAVLWGRESFVPQLGRKERFKRGALKVPPGGVSCFFQHKKDHLLGNSKAKTLRLKEDDKGLYFECDLPESAKAIREACKRGDVQGASVAFFKKQDSFLDGVREVQDAELQEISLVSSPTHESPITYRDRGHRKRRIKWSKLLWAY